MLETEEVSYLTIDGNIRKIVDIDAQASISSLEQQLQECQETISILQGKIPDNNINWVNSNSLNSAINAETFDRNTADIALSGRINNIEENLIGNRQNKQVTITQEIENEISRIDDLIGDRQNKQVTITEEIENEKSTRIANTTNLDDRISRNANDITTNYTLLNNKITNEITTRENAINSVRNDFGVSYNNLNTKIENETSIRTQRINTLENWIEGQISRINNELLTINNELSTIDNELSTINNELSAIDNELSTINNELSTINNELSTINN